MRLSDLVTLIYGLLGIGVGLFFLFGPTSNPPTIVMGVLFVGFGIWMLHDLPHLLSFLSVQHLHLTNTGFQIKDAAYSFADVLHLKFTRVVTRKTINFIPSGRDETAALAITIRNSNRMITFISGPSSATLAFGNLGKSATSSLLEKYEIIRRHTFEQRLSAYASSLDLYGYFVYGGMRIHRNGDVDHPKGRFNISTSEMVRLPTIICINQPHRAGRLRRKTWYAIDTTVDTDVFFFLMERLFNVRWANGPA